MFKFHSLSETGFAPECEVIEMRSLAHQPSECHVIQRPLASIVAECEAELAWADYEQDCSDLVAVADMLRGQS